MDVNMPAAGKYGKWGWASGACLIFGKVLSRLTLAQMAYALSNVEEWRENRT